MMRSSSALQGRLSVFVAIVITTASIVLTFPAGAVGDGALDTYLMTDPLPNGVPIATSTLLAAATLTDTLEDNDLAGVAFERTSLAGWTSSAPSEEVVDEIADFTIPPPGSPSEGLTSVCPVATTTTTTPTTTTTVATTSTTTTTTPSSDPQIPGSAEVSCTDTSNGLEKTGIAWIQGNVLGLTETIGLTNDESDADAATQYGLIPVGGIALGASRSYVVQRFALNSAVLTSGMKLTINRDAETISASAPTSVEFSGRQSSSGKSTSTHALAVKRINAVYKYFVTCMKQDGTSSETLGSIDLGSNHPVIAKIVKASAASSGEVGINLDYLK